MKIIVAMTCNAEDMQYINDSVRSLQEGVRAPDEIVVTLKDGLKVTKSLKNNDKVYISRIVKDYGELTALTGVMERYPIHSDVYILYLNSNCTYPPHLLHEYETSVTDLDKALKEKLPNSTGSVYGLGGIVMMADKKRNLEKEFLSLTGSGEEHGYELRTIHSYVRENATVDYLESTGSVLVHRSVLQDDFFTYLAQVWQEHWSQDVLLSNYFAKKNILRTQICNWSINRFLLHRGGYLKHVAPISDEDKRVLYENTAQHLRKLGCFHVYI